jgi:tryptophan synthase alpha subunit
MSNQLKIKVFGDEARQIKEGQIFIANVDSVEGRPVVSLVSPSSPEDRLEFISKAIGEFIYTSFLLGLPVDKIKDILVESVESVEDDFTKNRWNHV